MKPFLPASFHGLGFLLTWIWLTPGVLAADAKTPAPGQVSKVAPALFKLNPATKSFDFAIEQIEGSICLEGAYHGVTRLVDKRTGRQVIDSRYSALNLFKLHSTNACMGQPRTMERTTKSSPDGVEVHWAATEGHKGQITARYEVRQPNAVDVTIKIRSTGTYPAYEIFLSNYFDKALQPHVFLKPHPAAKGREAERVVPMVNEVFRGTVLVFPRDAHVARRCLDGRWDRSEFKTPTVQMCPVRHYGHCLAFMADAERKLAVVLMALPRHCYAISTRYHADHEADRLTSYSAFDLSLFGDDLLPGDERTVKVRLAVTELDGEMSQPLQMYRTFLAEAAERADPKVEQPKGKKP